MEIRAIRDDEVAAWVELRNAVNPRMPTMAGWVDQHRRGKATVLAVLASDGADVAA